MCKKALNGSKCGILEGWKNSGEAAKLREEDGDKECWRSGQGQACAKSYKPWGGV